MIVPRARLALLLGSGCGLPALTLLCLAGLLSTGAVTAGLSWVSGLAPVAGGYMLPAGQEIDDGASGFPTWALPCGPEPGALALDPSSCTGEPTPFPAGYEGFSTGQCTWYVATRRRVTWHTSGGELGGNGGQWLQLATAAGFEVGADPEVGAIAVYSDAGDGHVAFVVGVGDDGSYTVAEANWVFLGPRPPYVDLRGVPAGGTGSSLESLEGFIYGPGGAASP